MTRALWQVVATVLMLLLVLSHWQTWKSGTEKVQQRWDHQRARDAEAAAAAEKAARNIENKMQTEIVKLEKTKNAQIATINRRHAAIVDSLRNRPVERAEASNLPDSTSVSVGCTGAGLSKPDAEFLAGLAYDAARLQTAFEQCQAAYSQIIKNFTQPPDNR